MILHLRIQWAADALLRSSPSHDQALTNSHYSIMHAVSWLTRRLSNMLPLVHRGREPEICFSSNCHWYQVGFAGGGNRANLRTPLPGATGSLSMLTTRQE